MRSSPMQIDLYDIPAGIYVVKVILENSVATAKFIKS
jgi:hypothetical protein